MSKATHTPGPWLWNRHDPYGVVADGEELCRTREPADAQLIAASPDLLEFAQAYIRFLNGQYATREDVNALERMAKAAIAKAQGGGNG